MKFPNDTKRPNSNSGSMGQFFRSRSVMVHKSCAVAMIPHPLNPDGPNNFPWIQRPGVTYNVGRNAQKRMQRKARQP